MNPWLLAGLAAAGTVLVAVVVLIVRRRRRSVEATLKRLSWKKLVDFTIPDDVDEQIHVDLLLMSPAGLVVLDVRRIEGTVFAGENLDGWTALHGRGRTVVANPLPGLRARLHALRALVPDIPVKGYVLVLGEVSFSGPAPERVVTPVQLESVLPARTGAPSEALKAAWEAVEAAARRLSPGAKLR